MKLRVKEFRGETNTVVGKNVLGAAFSVLQKKNDDEHDILNYKTDVTAPDHQKVK